MKQDSVFLLCVTEDAGSDQRSQRLRLLSHIYQNELSQNGPKDPSDDPMSSIWYFDVSCLVHQFNLIVGSQLALIDECLSTLGYSFRYYSSLAKLIHSWRSIPSKIMAEFPPDHFASWRLPPSPCAARWGCVHELESFLIAIGVETVQEKFVHACVNFTSKRKASSQTTQTNRPIDEIALDEYSDFTARMSRYMKSATEVVKNQVFWFFVLVSWTCKEPLIECYAWLQKPREFPMVGFVTEEAYRILCKLQNLATQLDWVDVCLRESGASTTMTTDEQVALVGAAVRIAVHNASAFERRMYNYVCSSLGMQHSIRCHMIQFMHLFSVMIFYYVNIVTL